MNGEIMNCLMTNCHIIDDKYYNNYNNEEIYLLLNDEKTIKKIDLKSKKTFFLRDWDLTLIELK